MSAVRWCEHCDLAPTRRRNGLCDACNAYEHKYGERPGELVLRRRLERMETRRFERLARGA